ncbi:DUF438 domain-containing protein [Anaerococcus sp.]|uniref:DUF438 domain-containing protein n=1 Tax=Anaerococcus sp. TaxID=1872515 RepID=UPI0028FFE72D|nr:DUF438 domain-containing protein [Anaerococcus sp.]MDU3212323.1 DUF438 domain-containing protein [Anaerococcus sp.]
MKIDINENIAKLIHSNETLKNGLISIGFIGLDNPLMIKNMASKMSIKRGAKLLGISEIESKLESIGYEVIDSSLDNDVIERQKLIKSYIRRLSDGEDIENVRKDFKEKFDGVSSSEIMDAEQALLSEGMDKDEVRKLCDVHSSLFHGMTENENIKKTYENDVLKYFSNENNNINKALETYNALAVEEKFAESKVLKKLLNSHYRKKGDLIYPLLKSKYNKPGPSEVMWGVDYEILRNISKAIKKKDLDLLENTLARAEEMTYKEENILFPLLEENLSNEDYSNIYNDLSEYDHDINNNQIKTYNEASKQKDENTEGYIYFSKGRLRVDQLEALLDTMNIEITFVDEEDINSYYNNHNGDKVFKRPKSSLGRDVYSCHPPQAERKVRKIISDLKSGARDKVVVIRDIGGSDYTVTYYGVWDKNGNYKGILETVQNMDFYKSYLKKWNKL